MSDEAKRKKAQDMLKKLDAQASGYKGQVEQEDEDVFERNINPVDADVEANL